MTDDLEEGYETPPSRNNPEQDDDQDESDESDRAVVDRADETRHNISESADKIQLSTKIKRGEGTRDQDEIKVKVKGDDPQDAAETLHETVVAIGEQNTVNALRGTQPSGGDGDE